MVNIGTKTSTKIQTASPKQSLKLGNNSSGNGIKKAISTTKPSDEVDTNKTNEELEKDLQEEGVETSDREETALEKKKNLDKLLKEGRPGKKEGKEKKDTKEVSKEPGKEVDEEWQKNTNAKDKDPKRTDILKDRDQLKDVLKHDKDSIAKRYPGLERPGSSSSSASPKEGSSPSQNSNVNNPSNGSDSGISKLSDGGTGGSSGNGGGVSQNNHSQNFNSGSGFNNNQNFGNRDLNNFPRNNHDGGQVQEPNHEGHNQVAHTKFESLFTEGHLEGKILEARSSEDAQRIAATLRDVGAFSNIEQNGNSIKISGFNAEKSHDVHEAYGKVLGREFLEGSINSFSFAGVDEGIAGNLTKMLEEKAGEIGSNNHNINSSCSDGVCNVTVENNQEQYA
jgi:hypothetical protein